MATKLPGETSRGAAFHVPLLVDGQIALYVWALRMLSIRGEGYGGPTLGVEVGNEEVLRFDCHDTSSGHWHGEGYNRRHTPRASHRDFPAEVQRVAEQVGDLQDLVEFFATHDMGDYLKPMPEADFAVDRQRKSYLVSVDADVMSQIASIAKSQQVTVETLIDSWLREKVGGASHERRMSSP